MKLIKKRVLSLTVSFIAIISLIPMAHAATYDYPVDGGNLKFDPTTGTITDCDSSVFSANIPSEIYGVPVTAIKGSAFLQCRKLVSVTIPESVTSIGEKAFSECSALQSVIIPDSVTELGKSTFNKCYKLVDITLPGSISIIPRHIFYDCKALKHIALGEGIREIHNQAFLRCDSLKELILPDSINTIEYAAFYDCKELTTVTIGKNCDFISKSAFSSCEKMSNLHFSGNAPGNDGNIINKFAVGFKIYYPEGASGWTTPTWNGYITESYVMDNNSTSTTPDTPVMPSELVTPSQPQDLTTGGQRVDAWALDLVNEAIAANLVPNSLGIDLRNNITREQFAGVTVKLYEAMSGTTIPTPALADNIFTDTSNADVRKAYSMGFVSGTSATTFGPNSLLNREQAAVMLSNVYRALGGVISARNPGAFSDDKEISGWAKNAVYFMSENGIISGVGNNKFSAQGKTQSQAALVLALRMYQNLQ